MLSALLLIVHILSVAPPPMRPALTLSTAVRGYAARAGNLPAARAFSHPLPEATAALTGEEADLVQLTNQDRAEAGLTALSSDARLTAIARAHSEDMAARHYFDHLAPAPGPASPMERYLASLGYRPDYAMVGENIYYRSMTDDPDHAADQADTAFMNSPGHRANILQSRYQKIGIGIGATRTPGNSG